MGLTSGTRLGPHEILSLIGAGGMGEVYKARDTRLERIVAIKVLPAHLADSPALRERFEREAKTIAGLNHPHICTLYDVGRQDGIDFLVMEYLEGETLAMRLLKGPLPLEQVLRYAIEIADALDKAHRKGVTHRDLKPGNIMLIPQSGTKLLDFGLAKLKQAAAPANTPFSQLPTLTQNPTVQGTILGTMQYMSPEQLEGKTDEIDPRTDMFAFGAVMYEMATGKKAFEGKSHASLIGAIMNSEPPPMASLQPMTPPALGRVVKKCLAKEPERRWQAASDVCDELKWIAEGGSQIASLPAPEIAAKGIFALGRRALLFGLGALLVGAVIAGLATWSLKPAPPQPVSRFVITLPPGDRLAMPNNNPALAFSSDGKYLAYVATRGSTQQIYLRAMDSPEAKPIPGTEGAGTTEPFFSPDGQWLGYFDGMLKKISLSGGAPIALSDATLARGASWDGLDRIMFSLNSGALQQVSGAGGSAQAVTRLEKGEGSHRWPELLPEGKAVLFTAGSSWNDAQIAVQAIETGERRNLLSGGMFPRYAPTGHLVYAQGGTLLAVPFDAQRLEVTGTPVPVVEGVLNSPLTGAAQYSFSTTGSLAYVAGGAQAGRRLVWVSRNGTEQPVAAPARAYDPVQLSHDGRRVALDPDGQIWLYDIARDSMSRLTFEKAFTLRPIWTPDGKRIAFCSTKEGPQNVFWQMADGSGGLERLTTSENIHVPTAFSPDGQLLAFYEINPTTQRDIWVIRLSDRKAQPFLQTRANENSARFSPDGRWLAYLSDESGRYEVYVQAYPGPGGKWQISTDGAKEPVWNPNGRELFYRNGDKMMAVDITTQPSFSAGKPRMVFEGRYATAVSLLPSFDISPDGRRFLMIKESEEAISATQINVVLNWFEELKRRVPTR